MRERRRSKRVRSDGEIKARVKSTLSARVLDISPFGAQVELHSALRPGVECDVTVPVLDGELRLRSIVRRCRVASLSEIGQAEVSAGVAYRAGLEFVKCSQEEAARLRAAYGGRDERAEAAAAAAPRRRRGPIKIKVDPSALAKRNDDG